MEIQIRANDTCIISGYVNVTEKKSQPMMIDGQKVIEEIEPRAFVESLKKNDDIKILQDHIEKRVLGSTKDNTLILEEDAIGLKAEATISDKEIVERAREQKEHPDKKLFRGWSFGFNNAKATIEERVNDLPLRKVSNLNLIEVSLICDKVPCYPATSVECRAEDVVEFRAFDNDLKITEEEKPIDYSEFTNRLNKIKGV